MRWRHWSILIVLVLLNYLIFSTAFTLLAEQRQPQAHPTRTPQPTFDVIVPAPVAYIVLPTCTTRPTRAPITPSPSPTATATPAMTNALEIAASLDAAPTEIATEAATPSPTASPTPGAQYITHKIKQGETLSEIARAYGVSVQDVMAANNLDDPNRIVTGQELLIPVPQAQAAAPPAQPEATSTAKPTKKPAAATRRPPAATPKPTARGEQFTAEVIWDPWVAPNCSGPGISKQSIIRDAAGNPLNGVIVTVDCYGNTMSSHPSGTPGEYDPGHYDFSFGKHSPEDWTCTVWVSAMGGQPVASSQVVSVHFDLNDCNPHGAGHQVAIVNWTKRW